MQKAKFEFNNFSTGLVTDASAINTPEGVVLGCTNFELQLNGGLRLRPSLQKEDNNRVLLSTASTGPVSGHVWEAPEGDVGTQIILVQVGGTFKVLLRDSTQGSAVQDITPNTAQSPHGIFTDVSGIAPLSGVRLSYASTSKYCVITGLAGTIAGHDYQELVYILEYKKESSTITAFADVLWVRDFFGIPDGRVGGARSSETPPQAAVAYNLFNQGWGNEVTGTYPNKYVLNSFYNTAAITGTETCCVSQGIVAGTNNLVLNGEACVNGVYYSPAGASVLRSNGTLSNFFVQTMTVTGTDANGNPQSETVYLNNGRFITSKYYKTVTALSVVATGADTITIGEDNVYPGDYDNWILGVYAASATTRSFAPKLVVQGPDSAGKAPLGHFVVPLHYRSAGISAQALGRGQYIGLYSKIFRETPGELPEDRSGRPSKVAQFAGRFWYAGTRNNCTNEEVLSTSPSISNTIAFSRVVQTTEDCCKCFARNNPTTPDFNSVLADDGGHIVIQEMGEVIGLVPIGPGLAVLASNGVWMIAGNNESGFSATGYLVTKVSEIGCVSETGIVVAGDVVMFPSVSGIEVLGGAEHGRGLVVQSTTDRKVSQTYDAIVDLTTIVGTYDSTRGLARFLYKVGSEYTKELVMNTALAGWAETEYNASGTYQIIGALQFPATRVQNYSDGSRVPNSGFLVSDGADVYLAYLRYDDADGSTFGYEDLDGGSYAALSSALVGHISLGDITLNKYAIFLDVFCERTEDTYTVTSGDVVMNHESSCLVDAFWEWGNTSTSPYKAQQFEAYRYRRLSLLESADGTYPYNYGQSVICTNNKLRGHGKTLAVRIQPSAGKDCRPLGWSVGVGANR